METEMVLSKKRYEEIIGCVQNYTGCLRQLEETLSTKYELPRLTMASIINNYVVRKMRSSHYRVIKQSKFLWGSYQNAVAKNEELGIIVRMSHKVGMAPALMAKIMLEQYLAPPKHESDGQPLKDPVSPKKEAPGQKPSTTGAGLKSESGESELGQPLPPESPKKSAAVAESVKPKVPGEGRNLISRMFRDTSLIPDGRLSMEILMCQLQDSQYGPILEIYNRAIGEEYEGRLYEHASETNLCYQSEDDLRSAGYDKTPDLKLVVPIAVGGFVVNWIESKGLFGDEAVHRTYISEQYSSYWNRFGPGLVIYWLGYEETVADPLEKRFIVRAGFPKDITYMKPLPILPELAMASLSLNNFSSADFKT